jgi:hypothetical protein
MLAEDDFSMSRSMTRSPPRRGRRAGGDSDSQRPSPSPCAELCDMIPECNLVALIPNVGINRQLLLGSTVGSCWDRPSARSPVAESTIKRTNTRDGGARRSSAGDEHLREDHEAIELESWFALRTTEQLFCFLALLFKGKIKELLANKREQQIQELLANKRN